jgi:putative ABC transport system permease protein
MYDPLASDNADARSALLPLSQGNSGTGYYRLDRPVPRPGDALGGGGVSVVSPGYFKTMRIPLIAGRDFDARARLDSPRVAIVHATMARRFFVPIGSSQSWTLRTGA